MNCLEYIKTMQDASVDLILTDPPYNIAQYSTGNIPLPGRSAVNNDLGTWDLAEINPMDLVQDFKRIIKPDGNIFIFTSYNLIGKWHEAFDPEFDTFQYFIWHKTNPMPKIFKNGFLNSCEMIVCLWNKKHKWNFSNQNDMHNYFECPICMGKERIKDPKHPSQKPLKLLKHLIEIASNENDIVFDPFMGVGSTGVAALQLKRNFIGVEIDPLFYNAAERRIEEEKGREPRIEERMLILPALYIIKRKGRVTTSDLINDLTIFFNPSGEDAELLSGRSDTKFSQKVRNLVSHRESNGMKGYTTFDDGGYSITDQGEAYLNTHIDELDYLFSQKFK